LITCKQFLRELNDFLDDTVTEETREHWQKHVNECSNCFVIFDTTRKTLQVFKGTELQEIPSDVRTRLMDALERKMAAKRAQV
jgi:anti-sigma factor (TIGR02949 family)